MKKDTEMSSKTDPNVLKEGRSVAIWGRCYVILGLNEGFFCRKCRVRSELSLWLLPTINKLNRRKDLRPIMVDGLGSFFRKPLATFTL